MKPQFALCLRPCLKTLLVLRIDLTCRSSSLIQCKSNQLATRLSGDVPAWVEGIDKIGTLCHFGTMFLAGFIFGFVRGWQVTADASLACMLCLSLAFSCVCCVFLWLGAAGGTQVGRHRSQLSYANALAKVLFCPRLSPTTGSSACVARRQRGGH